jgi:hypothetical protein
VYGQPVEWENGFYPSAVFWCLQTAEGIGPDDRFVHPHVCTAGRACFREANAWTTISNSSTASR